MELGRYLGALHPTLIHFPIALLLVAVLFEAVAFLRRDSRLEWTARLLLLLGIVATLFAFVCGIFAHLWAARSGISQEAIEYHELLATITSWIFVALTGWRLLMTERTQRAWRGVWIGAALSACVLLLITGHQGGTLVREHFSGVQYIGPQRPPTHEDLFNLIQRQDPESLFYSNMMHHIFGWMVLGLALLLLLDQVAPKIGEKARRFGPLLLFAGGLFLMIFSDQDAWPLYQVKPFRPITDKEVLLHKTYALLMLVIGLRGMWTLWRRRASVAGEAGMSVGWRVQDRLMAVFALIGGALLFTHVHSGAPYANNAVGVYIHHTIMGLVALSIGAIKLMDDAARRPIRWRRLAYPALMGLEAFLLINYNEGLPWFLGYANQSSVSTRGGLVTPLGPHRAELIYDPATTRLELYVLRPDGDQLVPLRVQNAYAVVKVGAEATEVPLKANSGGETESAHFAGAAPFLNGLPLFEVKAYLTAEGRTYIADFEPWVDKTQASPSNLPFVCPMHPHVGAEQPGRCVLCRMPLQPNRPPRPAGTLHDPDFTMDLVLAPTTPVPGRIVRLTFTPRRTKDKAVVPLEVVHTQPVHLLIVGRDLAFFDHVHPQPQPDGSFALDYRFPQPGEYILFADVTPTGAANQVFRLPVTVVGVPSPAVPLHESAAPARVLGDYRVALTPSPYPARANDETTLTFSLSLDGNPVTDLEPFLGAAGHCVVIRQDTNDYLHSHPPAPPGKPVTGPQVMFHTRFPRPGLYKVWGQFRHRGHVLTADFVIRAN